MNTILKIIAPALLAVLFVLPAGAQTEWEKGKVKEIAERAYLYAALCEGERNSCRVCEALFTQIISDLGRRPVGFYPANPSIKFAELSVDFQVVVHRQPSTQRTT